ncbi:VPLPA-CTERM sorting domain-containing protein [Palleronia sp. KMU-117]|uniref:VPLPA-CTERM sorting domain-containing protein n=1 Tax=Palleronia sp. KMU-117 TaxID=3434108 RepID=UPI003D738A90
MKRAIFGATAAVALLAAGAVSAATVNQQVFASGDYAGAKAAEAAYLALIAGTNIKTENFESLPIQSNTTISTAVGTFEQTVAGQKAGGLRILDAGTSPFLGRRDMTNADNSGQWLDSNDSKEVKWTLNFTQTVLSLGFFMTDINDVSASMTATFANGDSTVLSFGGAGGAANNGEISYVTAFFDMGVKSVTFNVDTRNDGWGIDDITVSAVPLPAPALMLIGGLGALAAVRRKRKSA